MSIRLSPGWQYDRMMAEIAAMPEANDTASSAPLIEQGHPFFEFLGDVGLPIRV